MTHQEYLHSAIAEIAEELPGFDDLDPAAQGNLRQLGEQYFHEEFVPRLEGMINIPRYQQAMMEKNEADREFIEDQAAFLRSTIIRAQRAAHKHLLEKYERLSAR